MELNMWNDDFLLAGEWGLDSTVDQPNGLFGDLKAEGRLFGYDLLSFQPQDAVESLLIDTPSKDEDALGMEWMESADLGSYLDTLGSSNDKMLPLEASLLECTSSIASEELPQVKIETPVSEEFITLQSHMASTSASVIGEETLATQTQLTIGFDGLVSSPGSPEQVAPVITVDAELLPGDILGSDNGQPSKSLQHILLNLQADTLETSLTESDLISADISENSVLTFDDASELISSPLSADDVESMFSTSGPASPTSTSHSSIIESSPELYKVILTSSIEATKRFAPYSKSKPSKAESKGSRRTRAPAQPVPEHVIVEQLNKKDRKKLQNKNAAIRYRQKKKEEAQGIRGEEQDLEDINKALRTKVEDLQREIKYMKNLMEDVCRAKGLQ